jgi:hypothetical protein
VAACTSIESAKPRSAFSIQRKKEDIPMRSINKISAQNPALVGPALQQFQDFREAGEDSEFVHEDQHHVFIHDSSGRFLRSCTMTSIVLRDAVLAGKADDWNVVYYDQETGEAATICPRCAVGLSCRGSVS